jgi:uncharacterized membrane protein
VLEAIFTQEISSLRLFFVPTLIFLFDLGYKSASSVFFFPTYSYVELFFHGLHFLVRELMLLAFSKAKNKCERVTLSFDNVKAESNNRVTVISRVEREGQRHGYSNPIVFEVVNEALCI